MTVKNLHSGIHPPQSACKPKPRGVSLTVVGEGGPKTPHGIAKSKVAPWRGVVLALLYVVFVVHLAQWVYSGMNDGVRNTLSPLEPSESMQTLELGRVNAGFVLFAIALLSTVIFGRFFCGWGCHVVALQDACGWLMKKVGVHPKPFRSRLLLWGPLLLGLYMFVWPTFRREALIPLVGHDLNGDGRITTMFVPGKGWEYPLWLGDVIPFHHFQNHFMVEDFWATFAPWYIAVPYLLICGFATVYFMGSKAFCSYGCPYGGFFAPLDRLAPVRIRVTDDCEQCGHCTAVCTSNVRVHEEVRDFGMVVDPGCMKCMDCVSVCPKDALYLGVGTPAAFAKPLTLPATTRPGPAAVRHWDLSLREEIAVAGVGLILVLGFRGMYQSVPLLLSMGLASIGAFGLFKCWRLLRDRNVRGPFWQLKRDGRIRPIGWVFVLGTLLYSAVGAQGLIMNWSLNRGELQYAYLTTPREIVFAPNYAPTPQDKAAAEQAIANFVRAGAITRGGVGFLSNPGSEMRLAWLYSVAGDRRHAEAALRRALLTVAPQQELLSDLMQFLALRQASTEEVESTLKELLAAHPLADAPRFTLANFYLRTNRPGDAWALYESTLKAHPKDIPTLRSAALLALALGDADKAMSILDGGLKLLPKSPVLFETQAELLFRSARDPVSAEQALAPITTAITLQPTVERWIGKAQILHALGRDAEAEAAFSEAARLQAARGGPGLRKPWGPGNPAPSP